MLEHFIPRTRTHTDASQTRRHDPDSREAIVEDKQQALQGMAAGKQAVQRGLRDRDMTKAQPLENREEAERAGAGGVVVVSVGEAEAAEAGDAKSGREAARRRRQRERRPSPTGQAMEPKILEAVEAGGAEPSVEGGGGGPVTSEVEVEGDHVDEESAAGARVRGEDARDVGVGVADAEGAAAVGLELQVERSGEPYVAPPRGEGLRAAAVLGREEGDDVAEDAVGEAADAIGALFLQPSPLLGLVSGHHPPHRTMPARWWSRRRVEERAVELWNAGAGAQRSKEWERGS